MYIFITPELHSDLRSDVEHFMRFYTNNPSLASYYCLFCMHRCPDSEGIVINHAEDCRGKIYLNALGRIGD